VCSKIDEHVLFSLTNTVYFPQYCFANQILLINPACDVSGKRERLPRVPGVGQPENHKADLAPLGDELQPGIFSWHIAISLHQFCLGKILFHWGILETTSAYVQTYSVCSTQMIRAVEARQV